MGKGGCQGSLGPGQAMNTDKYQLYLNEIHQSHFLDGLEYGK